MITRRPERPLPLHPTTQRLKYVLLPLLVLLACLGLVHGVARGQDPDETIVAPGPELVIRAAYTSQDVHIPPPGPEMRLSPRAMEGATINVTYNGFSQEAQDAFQYAVDIWEGLLDSPVTIDVQANWTPLGANVLGSAGANGNTANFPGAPAGSTWFSNALADRRACTDTVTSETFEIIANFNSAFPNWYLDIDGDTPDSQWDFVTVVLHELGHGLGFAGSYVTVIGPQQARWDYSAYPGIPAIYTRFMTDGLDNPIISYSSPSRDLKNALEGDFSGILGTGIHAIAGNGGDQPIMYSPDPWESGSSFSHFDETYPVELMKPALPPGTAIHDPGTKTLGVLRDIGWGDELVIQAFGYNTSGSRPEWVQIQNHSSITITLSDYAIGDEEDRGGAGEGMFLLPDVDLAPGDLFTMRVRGDDGGWTYSTPDPTYCWNCGVGYTNLDNYSLWGGTAGDLDDAGDEVVLLRTNGGVDDPDGTIDDFIIDAICYGSGQEYIDTDGDESMDGRDKPIFVGGGCLTDLVSGSYQRAETVENCVPVDAHADNPTAITIASSDVSQAVATEGGGPAAWMLLPALCVTLVALFAHRRRTT
jgi:hypothetical protein